jgi:hypothetical protein
MNAAYAKYKGPLGTVRKGVLVKSNFITFILMLRCLVCLFVKYILRCNQILLLTSVLSMLELKWIMFNTIKTSEQLLCGVQLYEQKLIALCVFV